MKRSGAELPAQAELPTKFGIFRVFVWPGQHGFEPIAITTPDLDVKKHVLVRIHSECLTGDVFGSLRCDCGLQRDEALRQIAKSKNGVFIYLRQEGRGIGLHEKIRTYALQEKGYDTYEASIKLGHPPDSRDYSSAKKILDFFGIRKIKLLTNNPAKLSEIFNGGFEVSKIPLVMHPTKYNIQYFEAKRKKFKHTFGEPDTYHYFSITYPDLNHLESVDKILIFLRKMKKHPLAKIHIGFGVEADFLNNTATVSKLRTTINKILAEKDVYPVIHYNPHSPGEVKQGLQKISKLFPNLRHLQINMSKNYVPLFEKLTNRFRFVIPLNEKNYHLIEDKRFRRFVFDNASFLLLDNSGGNGKSESFESYKKKIDACIAYGLNNIALAGGFAAHHLDTYFKITDYYKFDFSIDAESRLQTGGVLDENKTKQYFSELLNA